MAIDLPAPAIIEFQDVHEVRFGLSYALSRTELDRFIVPRDWRDATIEDLRAYIPSDLGDMPGWALRSMFPLFVRKVGGGGQPGVKTTVFLTNMSASNQNWSVLTDWNSAENTVHCIGGGGSGGGASGLGTGGGGGGGAYSNKDNISLTPSGSATFRLGNLATTGTGNGGVGSDVWFNGSTLAGSSVGAKGGGGGLSANTGGSGGLSTSSIGSTKYNGGNGSSGTGAASPYKSGGGGGAAGPNGAGGNAPSPTSLGNGGQGGNGSGGSGGVLPSGSTGNAGGDGDEFQVSPKRGSGGGGSGIDYNTYQGTGGAGGNYGGGGGGAARYSGSANSGGQGAQGLIIIINNHLTGA